MRQLLALALVLGLCTPAFAQKDTMKMGESFGAVVKKAPVGPAAPVAVPVVVPPAPASAPAPAPRPVVASVPIKPLAPPPVAGVRPAPGDMRIDGEITGDLFATVKRAPAQIRDVVTFMAGWGGWGPNAAEFAPVVGPDLKVSAAGHSVPLKGVRLMSARGYTTLRNASGEVTGARIDQVVIKLARGFTRGSAELTVAPRAGGYTVTAVTIK